jgi:hypothetical protein
MNPLERTIDSFQQLVAQVPEILQPLIVALAGAIPFVEGEGAAVIGVLGGIHPVLAALAAATGNFLCVLVVVAGASRARTAVVDRRHSLIGVSAGGAARPGMNEDPFEQTTGTKPESKGRQRFRRWVVRFGVPGASILGPLAVPTQITSAILVGGGVPPRWVLLWQAVAIAVWTTIATVAAWAGLTFVVGS